MAMFKKSKECRDKVIVSIVSGLTSKEASKLGKKFSKAKNKISKKARGTMITSLLDKLPEFLQENKKLLGK